jgi:hypothetical protein
MPTGFTEGVDLTGQSAVPAALREMGPVDGTTYTSDQLNRTYQGGGIIIQPDGRGRLEAYPVSRKDIDRSTRLAPQDALKLNPKLLELIADYPELNELVHGGQVTGMAKSVRTPMIRLADLGYSTDIEVVLPGKGTGQRKPAGKDGYLGIGTNKEGVVYYWIVNCDQNGMPVNYLPPEAIERVNESSS